MFSSRGHCRKCGASKPGTSTSPGDGKDWSCPQCGDLVFGSRSSCRKCGAERLVTAKPTVQMHTGDWRCPKCNDHQFARNERCRSCGEARPSASWLGTAVGLAPPCYWTSKEGDGPPWRIVPADAAEIEALRLAMDPGGSLGGRDQRAAGKHQGFQLHGAWRLQHPGLWGKYAMERENLRQIDMKSISSAVPSVQLRRQYVEMAEKLPAALFTDVNEVFLSHGTVPDSVLPILSGGLNERFSGGLFGNGTYLAEDIGKNDQYCRAHFPGQHPELEKLLYGDSGISHPGDVFYMFVCRTLLGYSIRTRDGRSDVDNKGRSIWSSEKRELAAIPSSSPPVLHHSLVAETGGVIARYREFMVFHGSRIYPEYLVAYLRT